MSNAEDSAKNIQPPSSVDHLSQNNGPLFQKENNNKNEFQAPQFQDWRDRQNIATPSLPSKYQEMKNMLLQKEKTLRSCDAAVLPDGGQRLKDQIENLKLSIAACKIDLNNTTVPNNLTGPSEVPEHIHDNKVSHKPLSEEKHQTLSNAASKTGVLELSESTQTPTNNHCNQVLPKPPLVWAGPPPSNIHCDTARMPSGSSDSASLPNSSLGTKCTAHIPSDQNQKLDNIPPLVWAKPPPSNVNYGHIPCDQNQKLYNKPHLVWAKPPPSNVNYGSSTSKGSKSSSSGFPGTTQLNAAAAPFVPGSSFSISSKKPVFSGSNIQSNFFKKPGYNSSQKPVFAGSNIQSNFFKKPGYNRYQHELPGQDSVHSKQAYFSGNYNQYRSNETNRNMQSFNYNNSGKTYSKVTSQSAFGLNQDSDNQDHPKQQFGNLWSAKSQQCQYYGGRMSKARVAEVQTVTQDAVVKLHKALDGCPGPEVEVPQPPELVSSLMPHQRQALAWLLWKEKQIPPGGILADDMGLGKTLTIISLLLKQRHFKSNKKEDQPGWLSKTGLIKSEGTLVVCPASLLLQWEKEVKVHCQTGALTVLLYHGPNREKDTKKLASFDMVITTYAIVTKELGDSQDFKEDADMSMAPTLLRIAWERVVLDEAHTIKNPKSKGCNAVCQLRATNRWALTGTPIHNNLLDMYALLRFLRITPFDELKVWKKWVDNKTTQGTERLSTLMKSLLLRRTKDQLDSSGKALVRLPSKTCSIQKVCLTGKEKEVYEILFKKFKSTLNNVLLMKGANGDASKKDGLKGNQTLIFTLLLRLQQTCSHLNLLLQAVEDSVEPDPVDIAEELESLSLDQKNVIPKCNDDLNLYKYKDDPDFQSDFESTKVRELMRDLKRICLGQEKEKCVVVSQWTSMLRVVAFHLKSCEIAYASIQGNVPVKDRMAYLEDFNNPSHKTQVMLLSLKAGGVGLNLTGGNHLFLLDVHWNPALESQACDRVYRVGQTKDVTIHRFICENSVEEQILSLQKKKQELANSVLEGGAKCSTGITLEDLKQLFCLK